MHIGCNALYPYGTLLHSAEFTVEATQEALRRLKSAGYEAVEFSHVCHLDLAEAASLGQYAAGLGIERWSVHAEGPAGFVLGATVEEARAALLHGVEVCAAIGAQVLVVHAPIGIGLQLPADRDPRELMGRDRQVLEPALARARQAGVDLALENGSALAHMRYILQLGDALDTPALGFCVDSGHANLGDLGAPQAVRLAGHKLYTTHLHDNQKQVDDHLPPGRGTVPWDQLFAALRDVGYARTLMLELTDAARHRPYDQHLEMTQGAINTRQMAEKARAVSHD